ncbi:hypothetical protein FACS189413_11410 [Bacteroidia bacterium]|nr:hypothetical protein FACS189413_11410 [Bacteroidia bacterium]
MAPYSGAEFAGAVTRFGVGYPVGSFYLKRYAGLDANGIAQFYVADGTLTTTPDQEKDKYYMGNANPSWSFGWNNMFYYGNWEASFFFNVALGMKRLNMIDYFTSMALEVPVTKDGWYKSWDYLNEMGGDLSAAVYQARKDNPNRATTSDSDRWLEDASYLRLKNVSIAYRFPKKWLKFADVRLSLSAQNLLTITGYKGLDPNA